MHNLRFRQVHLDFHTSGYIPGIGEKFSKPQFQDALKTGNVNSVTLFAKCHHGYSYHSTAVGERHPHLAFDLLEQQIEACREIGVRCPIYLSAGFDDLAAVRHPEWLIKQRNGVTHALFDNVFFRRMSMSSPYLDYLCAQIEEVVRRWPDNDGIFLDIVSAEPDYSEYALAQMRSLGLNVADEKDVEAHAQAVLKHYYERTNAAVRAVRADTRVFHNSGNVPVGAREFNNFNTHFELESLPTGGWGYDHFPLSAGYAATQQRDYLGMTGKFHSTWGEFGGFKRKEALAYECAAMIGWGAKCSIGDQLHPSGEMNRDTYALIGEAYRHVERCEPWCENVRPAARIAIISAESEQWRARGHWTLNHADVGVSRMLLEAHLPFVVLDDDSEWAGFDLVILPDSTQMNARTEARINAFLKSGGKVLAAGSALIAEDGKRFVGDLGATLGGRSSCDPDYLSVADGMESVAVKSPVVIHGGAWDVVDYEAANVLAWRYPSYFNRTWEHYCSHQHTPNALESQAPGLVVNAERTLAWFAHNIFTCYHNYGQPLYRDFVIGAITTLLGGRLPVQTNLPTGARVNVLEQASHKRYIVHLLYAPKSLRGVTGAAAPGKMQVEVIEDLLPLFNTEVTIRLPVTVEAVRVVPAGYSIAFSQQGDLITFTVPEFTAHAMIELQYA